MRGKPVDCRKCPTGLTGSRRTAVVFELCRLRSAGSQSSEWDGATGWPRCRPSPRSAGQVRLSTSPVSSGVSLRPVGRLVRHIRPVLFWSPNMAAYDAAVEQGRGAQGIGVDCALVLQSTARRRGRDLQMGRLPAFPRSTSRPSGSTSRNPIARGGQGVRAASRIAVETSKAQHLDLSQYRRPVIGFRAKELDAVLPRRVSSETKRPSSSRGSSSGLWARGDETDGSRCE